MPQRVSAPRRDAATQAERGYRHEAHFYRGTHELVSTSVPFLREGLRLGEHAVVAIVPEKIEPLRAALGDAADRVTFIDMAACGRNPARIIQVWRDLVDAAELRGAGVRGIGEPVWAGRTEAELLEAELHEALLNVAFEAERALLLRCPYDESTLPAEVLATARVTHPSVTGAHGRAVSESYAPASVIDGAFADPLPEPAAVEEDVTFSASDLIWLRRMVASFASGRGMAQEAVDGLVLAMREIAANSVRHAGGTGRLRVWMDDDSLVCELSDAGRIREPMVGRLRPRPESESGRGVWIANQLCDLVQIRSLDQGTVIRLHMALPTRR
jgi:anti-sigma regulatory factor (Ser/Thr protein kinase)